jgi:hypothetical protein
MLEIRLGHPDQAAAASHCPLLADFLGCASFVDHLAVLLVAVPQSKARDEAKENPVNLYRNQFEIERPSSLFSYLKLVLIHLCFNF